MRKMVISTCVGIVMGAAVLAPTTHLVHGTTAGYATQTTSPNDGGLEWGRTPVPSPF
ncbi:MAG: hypothetical protein ACJ74O_05590 [Frankiaceae bacterium]